MPIKLTDKRSITKQIVSGICWAPVVVVGLCFAALMGVAVFGLGWTVITGGLIEVIVAIGQAVGMVALILAYYVAFVWSNSKGDDR